MGADDDVVEVRPGQGLIEKGPWIRESVLADQPGICHKPIAPAHLDWILQSYSLYEEQSVWVDLQELGFRQNSTLSSKGRENPCVQISTGSCA